jgi:AbrB family looped-hinge helix DNA binding protein
MQLYSTVTQKGQVLIPKEIRDATGITPRGRVQLFLRGRRVMLVPVARVERMLGFIPTKRHFTERDFAKAVERESLARLKKKFQ